MALTGLPISALIVLDKLASKGPMTPKQIRDEVTLSPRSVSDALRRLTDKQICKRTPNLLDMRQPIYSTDPAKLREMRIKFDDIRAMTRIYMKIV
ncbi:MAG: helix-turn-helix domain-containing protein [Candidatus Thorarchaeota archaeon]|nr:helix-turn-helix domain-containing protein [Candidatus Thorarchaeota archaeon]